MMHRTHIRLDPPEHQCARRRAAELGIPLAEYIRRLLRDDLERPRPGADVSTIFDLGDSGGSDVAAERDASAFYAAADRGDASHERATAPHAVS